MFVSKHFINTGEYISESKRCNNAKPSAYYFYMRKQIFNTKYIVNFRKCFAEVEKNVLIYSIKNIKIKQNSEEL